MLEARVKSKSEALLPVPLKRLLVAYDGSRAAIRALDLAAALGREHSCELLICYAADRAAAAEEHSGFVSRATVLEEALRTEDQSAATTLESALRRATAAGAHAATKLCQGAAARAIVGCAGDEMVDAIVIGTHGRFGLERLLLGSTAEEVVRTADVPVFVVHADAASRSEDGFRRILVALDDSDPSDVALDFALDLAVSQTCRLLCCTVVETADLLDKAATYGYDPTPFLDEMHRKASDLVEARAARGRERGITVHNVVVEGDPSEAILAAATDHDADLIAIGTHGRRSFHRFVMGSVAERVNAE